MHVHFVLSIFFALEWIEEPPIVYNILYGGWNVYPVTNPVGTLEVPRRIADCPPPPSAERKMGLIDAEFDNLFIIRE